MNIEIRKSTPRDIDALCSLFDEARSTIKLLGIDQWQNGYPSEAVISDDMARGQSYTVEADGHLCGTFALIEQGEPTYDSIFDGNWLTGNVKSYAAPSYFALHRVAVSVKHRGHGISTAIIEFAQEQAIAAGKSSLRIDTHRGNTVMRKMLGKHGFVHCGTIFLDNGDERVAYEKVLQKELG